MLTGKVRELSRKRSLIAIFQVDEMNPLILQMRFTATRTDTRPRFIATAKRLLYQETADKTTRSGYQYLSVLHFSFI